MEGFRRNLRGARWAFVAASVLAAMSAGLSGVPMSADPLEALRLGGGTVVCCVVPGTDGSDEVAWAADAAELLSDYARGCASTCPSSEPHPCCDP